VLSTALGVAAGLVALAFALSTFERWRGGRRRHELAWTIALAMFSLASFSLAAGSQGGWNGTTFRLFWLFGAVANVPLHALGTIYLLAGGRTGDRWAVAIGLAVAFAAGVIVVAPFHAPLPSAELPQGSDVFGPLPRILAAVASGGGALVVFGGAAWSAVRYRGGRMTVANVLIAAGTAITGASGLANSVLGHMTAFVVFLVAGIVVIFAGFLVASSTASSPKRPEPLAARDGRPRRETAGLSAALGVEAFPPRPAEATPRT
jgi:hypothetical protein